MQHNSLLIQVMPSSQLRVKLQVVRLELRPGRFRPNVPLHIIGRYKQDGFGEDGRIQCFLMRKKAQYTNG